MAKKSVIERDLKRRRLVKKYYLRRRTLKQIINNIKTSYEERFKAQFKLQGLPRDSNPIRQRNRCFITGRPRGFYNKFGLSRNKLRESAMTGYIPGLTKSSW
ncbi:30S ribosomal protein S14 [Candidatus Portiera aleyrodidarum]|uniref:30S ribosomal protein S14 n=1 Tax=Candidatus Portiera aleyrodidarum TaxID=91844 RepID=UPI000C77DE76|nr:30S ribosomal protein S14 [Candidatus Portiera aleyrodidarum]AUI72985.1 30S ribosomal protein S14 [Candidatus Portiera aleyrodidarum]AUI73234.1 30S ribosomal protein S14 [Candidatus Portiera aleyrodidarum]